MKRGILAALLSVWIVGRCSMGNVTYATTLPERHEEGTVSLRAEPVDLFDLTGHVTGIGIAPDGVTDAVLRTANSGVAGVPGAANQVYVAWIGGACESRVRVAVLPAGSALSMIVESDRAIGGLLACPAIGIARAITVWFDGPIDAAAIQLTIKAD